MKKTKDVEIIVEDIDGYRRSTLFLGKELGEVQALLEGVCEAFDIAPKLVSPLVQEKFRGVLHAIKVGI